MSHDDDPRLADLLQVRVDDTTEVVIIGFPCDDGVRRNGGRPGANLGPEALRRALLRMTPDPRLPEHRQLFERTSDLGDVVASGDLEADQELLGQRLGPELLAGRTAVVLGGGHETAYGHFLGHLASGKRALSIVNIDAHPDVRPLIDGQGHSGSPFRQALEHPSGLVHDYTVCGLQPQSVAASHLEYLDAKRCQRWWADELDERTLEAVFDGLAGPTMATFDLDAVDAAFAPGVSAPAASGLAPELWLEAAERAGRCPWVRSFDIVELAPKHDRGGSTARLAALTVWRFLRGRARRRRDGLSV